MSCVSFKHSFENILHLAVVLDQVAVTKYDRLGNSEIALFLHFLLLFLAILESGSPTSECQHG